MAKQKAMPGALKLSFPAGQTKNEDTFIYKKQDGIRVLAAFDGCGGVGGRRYAKLENRTGAHIASTLYAQCLADWFLENASHLPAEKTAKTLDILFAKAAADYHKQFLSRESTTVTGTMVRTLPSTAAIMLLYPNKADLYWAGNTRAYLLTKNGLAQLSCDDHTTKCDAFDSLYLDAPISNYLCADRAFSLHEKAITLPEKGVLVLATDGAYQACPSPMHFEALLLDTLWQSAGKKQWKQLLIDALQPSAADDATLLLQPFGFSKYAQLRPHFDMRRRHLHQAYLLPARQSEGHQRLVLKTLWEMYQKEQSAKNSYD